MLKCSKCLLSKPKFKIESVMKSGNKFFIGKFFTTYKEAQKYIRMERTRFRTGLIILDVKDGCVVGTSKQVLDIIHNKK